MGQMVDDVRLAVNGAVPGALLRPHRRHDPRRPRSLRATDEHGRRGMIMAIVFEKPKMPHRHAAPLLPRLHPWHHPPPGGRGHWTKLGMQDKAIGVAPVGCAVFAYNYFNCDMYGGRPRPRPGGGHRAAKRVHPRQRGLHLPGRRRPGLHRHRRDRPRRHPGREDHRHLRQQRHLRHDRRPDGPHHPARPDDHHLAPMAATPSCNGYPIRISEMLATLDGPAYIARVSACTTSSTS